MSYTQASRYLELTTPLGQDALLIRGFSCSEKLSGLYEIEADVAATPAHQPKVKADALVGKPVCIELRDQRGKRYFHGIVRRLRQCGREDRFAYYRLEIVPSLWLLTCIQDSRVYQAKTIPDIVGEALRSRGIGDVEYACTRTHRVWDYCVQYRETDFAFLSRLMEQEGIFYFFKHTAEKHILVIADAKDAHPACPVRSRLQYVAGAGWQGDITAWETSEELRPGLFSMRDHQFQLPKKTLEVTEPSTIRMGGNGELEIYDYPGEYARLFNLPEQRLGEVQQEGESAVRLRMESEEAAHHVATGDSFCPALAAGHTFDLADHFRREANSRYTVTAVEHTVFQTPTYENDSEVERRYRAAFSCIPHRIPFRPARVTRKPVIGGPQTAVVVGPPGEEIYVDKYGRVKVQFFWDRKGRNDASSSCWIRVATPWAGNHWGMIHIPRIGQEVVVSFVDGDLDQPIILGSVWNPDQMPPYDLPANVTQSGVKSRSSKGGGAGDFNEIRFEDKKGSEEVYVHAEKKLTTVVEASESRSVGASRTTTIHRDDTETIEEGNREVKISKGDDTLMVSMGGISVSAPLGTAETKAKEILLTATTHLKIVCGGSSIDITPASITITSPLIKLNC